MKLCPCGKPARRKWCSDKCARFNWRKVNQPWKKEEYRKRFRAYHKAWREEHKDNVRKYARTTKAKESRREKYKRDKAAGIQQQRSRAYYLKNAERIKARTRVWALANKERNRENKKAYREAHKKELSAKQMARHLKNPGKAKAYRTANAARLKQWQKDYNRRKAAEISAKKKARLAKMDPEKTLERERKYRCKKKTKDMEMEFSLLAGLLTKP